MSVFYKTFLNLKKTNAFVFLFVVLLGCEQKNESSSEENYLIKDHIISLTEKSTIKSRIKIEKASQEVVHLDLDVNGYVKAIPNQFAKIAAPFVGRITKSHIKLGQKVKKGTPIFSLSSSDFFIAQQTYLTTYQELKVAEINLKRQEDLLKNAVGVKRELEAAELDYKVKKLALNQAVATLNIYNVNPLNMKIGEALIVTSPIAGTIIQNDLIIGDYVKEDSEALVTIAELSQVWIAAQVKEKDLAVLKNLNEVLLFAEAYSNTPFIGQIVNIGDVVNEDTRSVEVLIEVNNAQNLLKPGMYVSVKLKDSGKEMLVIPTKAIFQEKDDSFIFLQIGENQFKKQKIKSISTNDPNKTAILEGLKQSDQLIIDGGIYLLQAK